MGRKTWGGGGGGGRREMSESEGGRGGKDGKGGVGRWEGQGLLVILQGVWGCQRPCNPPPSSTPALHPLSIISSTSPWQTGSALYQTTSGYLSPFSPPFLPSGPHPICHSHPSVLVSSQGQAVAARLGLPSSQAWQGGADQFPQWRHLESPLMGLGTFANLSTSFGSGNSLPSWSGLALDWEGSPLAGAISGAMGEIKLKGCVLVLQAAELHAEWFTNKLMYWLMIRIVLSLNGDFLSVAKIQEIQ